MPVPPVHKDNPDGAVATALLLVTDHRWRKAAGRLMRQIDESGIVRPEDLDVLAQTFLVAGPQVYWEVPGQWFDGPAVIIDIGPQSVDDEPKESSGEGPVIVARDVRPPLRRWAAGRLVRADSGVWGQLVRRAREMGPRGGAAIVRGVLDGVEDLTPAARTAVLTLATEWPQRDVREAAAEITNARRPKTASSAVGLAPPLTSPRDAGQASLF